jgi:hypothetical protein
MAVSSISARAIFARAAASRRGVTRFINIQNMFRFFNVGIHIKRGRKPPPAHGKNEAMVSQVIVPISNSDIEGNAPKELLKIARDIFPRAPMIQKFSHFEITCSLALIQ